MWHSTERGSRASMAAQRRVWLPPSPYPISLFFKLPEFRGACDHNGPSRGPDLILPCAWRFAFCVLRLVVLLYSRTCRNIADPILPLESPVSGPQSPVPSLGSPVSFYGTGSRGDGRLQAEERADHRRRWVYWLARHHQSGQEIRGLQGGRLRQAGLLRDTQQSEVHPEQPELQIHQGRHPVSRLGDVRSGDGAD